MLFGQPQFLPFLALSAVPLLVHLLAQRQRRLVPFSMTRFLQEVAQQTQGRRWLRELLLLLLRTAVVLFALLSLARPYAPLPLPLPPAPTAFVFVLDNSLSLRARDKGQRVGKKGVRSGVWFERAKEWCEKAFATLPADIALVAADRSDEPLCPFTAEPSQRLRALKSVPPTFRAMDLTAAMQLADTLLSAHTAAVKRLVVVTDLQSEPFRSLRLPSLRHPFIVVDVKPEGMVRNARLTATLRLPLDPKADGTLVAQLRNLSRHTIMGEVRLSVRGKPFARRKVTLPAHGNWQQAFSVPSWALEAADKQGIVRLEVRWDAPLDNFSWDDVVTFAFRAPSRLRVAKALRDGRSFVDAALRVTGIEPFAGNWQEADALIASAPQTVEQARALATWLRKGGNALLIADAPSPLWSFLNLSVSHVLSPVSRIGWVDETNPALTGLGAALQAVTVQPSLRIDRVTGKVLGSLRDGTPFLVEVPVGEGRCFLLLTSLNPQRTNFVYSPTFVPLLHRLIRFAVYGDGMQPQEAEQPPTATLNRSTVVPLSESDFRLPPREKVVGALAKANGALLSASHSSASLFLDTPLKDLTLLSLTAAVLCLLAESALTLLWWGRGAKGR